VNNNRLFQARFEKYLNAPEETSQEDAQYRAVISEILTRLAPGNASTQNVDLAFRLLTRGSSFDSDARLCDSIADAVYSAWKAMRAQNRLAAANTALDQERRQDYWSARTLPAGSQVTNQRRSAGRGQGNQGSSASSDEQFASTSRQTEITRRIAEVETQIKANQIKRELSEIQAKVEFQALIVQFFLQRRFQHVLMATRFYRAVFTDGDTKLNVGKDTRDLFERSAGMPPTVGTLDSMANEVVRDVREGVRAYNYLLEKNDWRARPSGSRGVHCRRIHAGNPHASREKKRQALQFAQKSNQLISAIE
jgi:hypothetical protein